MTFSMKTFSGALVVAGLVAACGGEAQDTGVAADETGRVESREEAPRTVTIQTGTGESVTCFEGGFVGYQTGFGCYLASGFTHQYHTGYSVNFAAMPGHHQFVPYTGLIESGYLAGDQSLYVGPGNGMATFKGGTMIVIAGYTLQERMVGQGVLAQDTCLKRLDGTKVGCAGGYGVSFWSPPNGPSYQGYLDSCQPAPNLSCP